MMARRLLASNLAIASAIPQMAENQTFMRFALEFAASEVLNFVIILLTKFGTFERFIRMLM